jgi:hypothetical protein
MYSQYAADWHAIWLALPSIARAFSLLLLLLCIYSVYLALAVLAELYSSRKAAKEDAAHQRLTRLSSRCANARQASVWLSYLFGFVLSVQLQHAFWTPDNHRPVGLMIVENFQAVLHFAVAVFLVLLGLHSIQWLLAARIRRAMSV